VHCWLLYFLVVIYCCLCITQLSLKRTGNMFETKCNNVHCVSKNGTDVAQCNSTWSTNFNYFWQRCCWERHDWKDTISRVNVNVSPGRAETLVMRGGITSHNLIAYSLSNISAKYYQNRFMCIEVNSVQHQCRFFWDTV